MELGFDTQLVILAAGLMFLWALVLGVVKYRQILASPEWAAHPYTDIAHRAALLYSFALMLIAAFVELSAWSAAVNLAAAAILTVFFVVAVASYMEHGLRRDTTNQLAEPSAGTRGFMMALLIGEIVGFAVLFVGFAVAVFA
ncbi:MAG TPA: hypothetical protein VJ782_10015 [Aeromicrobium sp.]|nr:hypothetical protein [Aeromicrobium sp.]